MITQIWRVLAQILFERSDTIEIIKPFFANLKNENINNEKYLPFLKSFSKYQLEILYEDGILTKEIFDISIGNTKGNQSQSSTDFNNKNDENNNNTIEEIISGDKIIELQELLEKKDISAFKTIQKSFKEVPKMKIPLLQYCVMKKAIECFKYLLVNGYDDPNKLMEEQNPLEFYDVNSRQKKKFKRYEWDCMATAIYFGNKEIIKIHMLHSVVQQIQIIQNMS